MDARTPVAWQHRDMMGQEQRNGGHQRNERNDSSPSRRYTPTPNSQRGERYGGPPTPNSAHSRHSRTPDHRRDARGSSSERYSHQSTKKLVRNSRSAQGSSRGSQGGYRSQPSPSSTEETAEETTETDSQNEQHQQGYHGPGGPAEYLQFQQQQPYMYPQYAYPMQMQGYPMQMQGHPGMQPQLMGPVGGHQMAPPQFLMAPNGSIRSVQSVPMLAAAASAASIPPMSHTWDGEPCPVHHQHAVPLAALYGLGPQMMGGPASVPPSVISGATTVRRARSIAEISNSGMYQVPSMPGTPHMDHKSFHGSMMIRGNPHAHNHKMVMAENGAPSHLPMRDPKRSTLPHGHSAKDSSMSPRKDDGLACCSGHFVVLWIILGIITFGILLGVVLMFTVG